MIGMRRVEQKKASRPAQQTTASSGETTPSWGAWLRTFLFRPGPLVVMALLFSGWFLWPRIDRWSQQHAAQWWETVGKGIMMSRDRDAEVGSLATIQAEPVVTET